VAKTERFGIEIIKHPDGRKIEFRGFYTEEALFRARNTRRLAGMMAIHDRTAKASDYLRFLAELFDENERIDTDFKDTTCPSTGRPCIRGCFDIRGDRPIQCMEWKPFRFHPSDREGQDPE
jgi:hypothetical protein